MRIEFKNKKIESIAKRIDKFALFFFSPLPIKLNDSLSKHWKIEPSDLVLSTVVTLVTLSAGCTQEKEPKTPIQAEQQTSIDIPAIKIIDNKLFVDDKEMRPQDFLKQYCFAKKDNQICVEVQVLGRIQNNHAVVAFPKDF
jgi:hypothetical protein